MDNKKNIIEILKESQQETSRKQETTENNEHLKQELDAAIQLLTKLQQEKQDAEIEHTQEQKRWEDTIKNLKQVINESDKERKTLEQELQKLLITAKRCSKNECMIVELKYNIEKITEDHSIEKEIMKEEIERVLIELGHIRHEKEEVLSEKLLLEKEVSKYKEKIKSLEDHIKEMKKTKKSSEIANWCTNRNNRRELIKNKQDRIYSSESTKKIKNFISNP
jgi:chromosome segregation ATPase